MRQQILGVFCFAVGAMSSTAALAEPTKDECIAANEGGQDLQRDGHLRAAVDRFSSCTVPACPGPLRTDCVRRRDEAQRVTPVVELVVSDAEGRSVASLEVRIDGTVVDPLPKLSVDPGGHLIELRATGYVSITRRLELHAGDRIHEDLVMRREMPSGSPVRGSAHSDSETATENGRSKRTLAYVLGGVGALAIGVGAVSGVIALNAKSDRDDACRGDYPKCTDPSRDSYLKDRETRIATAGNISTVALIGGALLVVAGAWLLITSNPRSTRAGLQPWQTALTTGTLPW